jgi:hypothetical protein
MEGAMNMACGDRVQVTVTSWGVCWKWIFPYPCKKSSTQTRYEYVFNPYRSRFAFFAKHYEGCCGGVLFKWPEGFAIFGTGNGPWVNTPITKLLSSPAEGIGDCPFTPTGRVAIG